MEIQGASLNPVKKGNDDEPAPLKAVFIRPSVLEELLLTHFGLRSM